MRTRVTLSVRLALVGWLAGGLMAASAEEAASQTNFQRNAPISKFSGVEEIVNECTTSDSTAGFVDMPGMTRNFTLGGNTSEEVIVMFHAAATFTLDPTEPPGSLDTGFVQLEIDGAVQSPGNQIEFIGTGVPSLITGAYSFTWQSAPLTPGSHTALIRWRTDLGSEFCVNGRTMIILHN
jgi:hypothetical protein